METVLPCALHTECASLALTAPLSLSLSLAVALCLYLALAILLSLVEISVQNFKFQCWVSQWLHTQTHAHIHAHMHTHSRIPIDSFQFCFRCPFQFVRECTHGLSCVLSVVYSLWIMRVFRLSLNKLWFYLACSLSLKENNHFTLKLDSIYVLIVQVGLPREQQLK